MVRVMVFNATFNNISAIPWRSVLLVEKTEVAGENHRFIAIHWQTLSHNVVLRTFAQIVAHYYAMTTTTIHMFFNALHSGRGVEISIRLHMNRGYYYCMALQPSNVTKTVELYAIEIRTFLHKIIGLNYNWLLLINRLSIYYWLCEWSVYRIHSILVIRVRCLCLHPICEEWSDWV